MKKVKELMKGLRRKEFKIQNGTRTIVKELAHYFDNDLEEHFCYIYKIEELINGKYNEYYLGK